MVLLDLWFNVKTMVFTPAASRVPGLHLIHLGSKGSHCWELCTLAVGKLNLCWLVPSRFSLKSTLKLYQIILYIYIYIHPYIHNICCSSNTLFLWNMMKSCLGFPTEVSLLTFISTVASAETARQFFQNEL